MELDPQLDLTFTRDLAVPVALVWECWTTPAHIKQFFVPKPHRVIHCDIDLRVGGRFNTTFDVEGNQMENNGIYLDVIPLKKLVFTDGHTEGWKPMPEPFLTAIIDLADNGKGGTIYTATARHRTAEACKTHADMGFYSGWGTVADQLESYAKSL